MLLPRNFAPQALKKQNRSKMPFWATFENFDIKMHFFSARYSSNLHYEAKLCILCILCGFHNRPKSDLWRNQHHCYFSLIFFDVMDSTNKYLKHCSAQNRSKNRRVCGIRNRICGIQNSLWSPQTNNKTCV